MASFVTVKYLHHDFSLENQHLNTYSMYNYTSKQLHIMFVYRVDYWDSYIWISVFLWNNLLIEAWINYV